jgi:hypothetical protein
MNLMMAMGVVVFMMAVLVVVLKNPDITSRSLS